MCDKTGKYREVEVQVSGARGYVCFQYALFDRTLRCVVPLFDEFSGVEHGIETVIMFREQMPNNSTFIILGEHVSWKLQIISGVHILTCLS
jgi:hypothetical protein